MRQIGTIPGQSDAQRFGDYLVAIGVPNSVEPSADGWAVWVEKDDDLDRAKAELASFIAAPSDARFGAAARDAQRLRRASEKRQRRLRERFVDVRTRWSQPRRWGQPLTMLLIALIVLAGIGTRLGEEMEPLGRWLLIASVPTEFREPMVQSANNSGYDWVHTGNLDLYVGRLPLTQLTSGQVWRAFTPALLHFGAIHLIFNVYWLFVLGGRIESSKGSLVLAGLVIASAAISNLAQYATGGHQFGGFSGVNYALFGYLWVKTYLEPTSDLAIGKETIILMVAWLFLGGLFQDIAHTAHFVGLAVGAAAGARAALWRRLGGRG
jgi:GlpG protein